MLCADDRVSGRNGVRRGGGGAVMTLIPVKPNTPEHTQQVSTMFAAVKQLAKENEPMTTPASAPQANGVKKPAPKSKLKAVDPKAAEPSKPKILIFGKPGVGKTWASLDFPNVYYIDTEGGADLSHYTDKLKKSGGMYFGIEQGSLDFDEVIDQIQALATENHDFKTVVIDSFTKLYLTCAADAAEKVGDDFGRDKKEANKPTRRLINWLNRLDMNVILIAHEKPQWGLDDKKQRSEIGTTFDAYDKLEYELHLCLNIQKNGPQRLARVKKSRLQEFPEGEAFQWSYAEFSKRYGQQVIEQKAKALTLATPEQMAEFKTLLEVVKIPDNQLEKWLTAASASAFEEVDAEKMTKIITHLKTKIKGE